MRLDFHAVTSTASPDFCIHATVGDLGKLPLACGEKLSGGRAGTSRASQGLHQHDDINLDDASPPLPPRYGVYRALGAVCLCRSHVVDKHAGTDDDR